MNRLRISLLFLLLVLCSVQSVSAASALKAGDYPVDQFPMIPAEDRIELEVSGHTYYKVEPGNYSWKTAEAICEKQGAHLVTITTLEEAALVMQMTEGETYGYWIGAEYSGACKEGKWVTEEDYDYAWLSMIDQEQYWGDDPAWLMKFGGDGYAWYAGEGLGYTMTLPDGTRGMRYEAGFIIEWDGKELVVTLPEDQVRQTYTGGELRPRPIVTDAGGNLLAEGTDYVLYYEDNIEPGPARVVADGAIGGYGEGAADFKIVPRPVENLKVANYTGSFELEWTPREEADGYLITLWPNAVPDDVHKEIQKDGSAGKFKIRRDYLRYEGDYRLDGDDYHLEVRTLAFPDGSPDFRAVIEDDAPLFEVSDPAIIESDYRESYLEIGVDTNSFRHNNRAFGIREGEGSISDALIDWFKEGEDEKHSGYLDEQGDDEDEWGGWCQGLALSVAEAKIGNLSLDRFRSVDGDDVAPVDYYHLVMPADNPALKEWISAYYLTQMTSWGEAFDLYLLPPLQDAVAVFTDAVLSRKEIMERIVRYLGSVAEDEVPVPLGLAWKVTVRLSDSDSDPSVFSKISKIKIEEINHMLLLCGLEAEDDPDYWIATVYDINYLDRYTYLFIEKQDPGNFFFSYSKEAPDPISTSCYPNSKSSFKHIEYWRKTNLDTIQAHLDSSPVLRGENDLPIETPLPHDGAACPECGYAFPNGQTPAFCTNCGAALVHACASCGYVFDGATPAYCTNCGAKQGG